MSTPARIGALVTNMADFGEARRALTLTFARAAVERHLRQEFDDVTGELGWVLFERDAMHSEVNRLRKKRGLPPVDLSEIIAVENSAKGHSDYSVKFALRCAELTLSQK